MVSNNILNQKYNVQQFGQAYPGQSVGQSYIGPNGVPMQAQIDAQQVQQAVDNSYLSNRVKASAPTEDDNPLAKLGLSLAAWYGLSQAMDKFGPKCAGKYEDSILGRLGNWGDKVSNKFSGSWIGQQCQKVSNGISSGWNWIKGKSKVAAALGGTPTKAEWNFARGTGEGLRGMLAMDTSGLFKDGLPPIKRAQQLEQFGYSQAQIDAFETALKGMDKADRPLALLKEELKAMDVPKAKIDAMFDTTTKRYAFGKDELKALGIKSDVIDNLFTNPKMKSIRLDKAKLSSLGVDASVVDDLFNQRAFSRASSLVEHVRVRKWGFNNMNHFKKCTENVFDNIEEIGKALQKADDKMSISIWRKSGTWGKIKSHLFGRKVSLSELRNKFTATLGTGNKTKLGRALPKALGWLLEGGTNRFAGGKIAVLFQAFIFGDMLYHSLKAPKGEKLKTLGERGVNDFAYFMAAPLAYGAMHKVGGLKYAGLDKAGVDNYRAALKAFNDKAKAGGFATKAEYKAAKKALSDMLNAGVKNPITKFFKGIGRFINIGNETRAAYVSKSALNMNWLRKIPNFLKNCAGVPMRIAIPMMMITPLIAKVCTKGAHAIFGRPTHSVLDEEPEEPELTPEQQQQAILEELQRQQAQQNPNGVQPNPFDGPIVHNSPTNLLNMRQNGDVYRNTTNTYNNVVTQDDATDDGRVLEPYRTYIPSPEAAQVPGEDMTAANAALARADIAEKQAMDVLAMKW